MKTLTLLLCLLVCRPAMAVINTNIPAGSDLRIQQFHSLYLDSVATNPSPPKKDVTVGCVVAILILIAGAIVIYKLIQFCKAHFPPPPQATNSVPTNGLGTNTTITSAFVVPGGTNIVWSDPECPDCNCTFVISYGLSPTNADATSCAFWRADQGLELPELRSALLTNYGLVVTLSPGEQFTTNGAVVGSIPYDITYTNGVLSVTESNQPSRTVVVERLTLKGWKAVLTNVWSSRFTNCTTMDPNAPASTSFYRARVVSP